MSIKKADSAGFCFGVNRAINIVNELLKKGIKVATLGPIIHNMEMVERVAYFESKGKLLEAQRIKERTMNDIEMLQIGRAHV